MIRTARVKPAASEADRLPDDGPATGIVGWLDDRFPFVDSVNAELYRSVPNYATAAYRYLGGGAVMLILVEFVTRFLLGIYYVPGGAGNPPPPHKSAIFIQHTPYPRCVN